MSATLDAEMFAAYFSISGSRGSVPCLKAGGRTFPVEQVITHTLVVGLVTSTGGLGCMLCATLVSGTACFVCVVSALPR